MLIPFGPHLVKSSLSSLSSYFLHSPTFPLTHTQFGSFQSALSLPNLFIPFLGGLLLDLRGSPLGTCLFLLLTLVGHTLFTLSCSLHSYPSALLSRALFGLGQGSTVVAQGRIAAIYFRKHEMVFAIAACESMHNLSALIARLYVVPMAEWSGTYMWSLCGGRRRMRAQHGWRAWCTGTPWTRTSGGRRRGVKELQADFSADAELAEEALDTTDSASAPPPPSTPASCPPPPPSPSTGAPAVSASVSSLLLHPPPCP